MTTRAPSMRSHTVKTAHGMTDKLMMLLHSPVSYTGQGNYSCICGIRHQSFGSWRRRLDAQGRGGPTALNGAPLEMARFL